MTQRYIVAAVLLILAWLGYAPEALFGLPLLVGDTDDQGGEGGGNGEGGDDAGGEGEGEGEGGEPADPAAPKHESWADKMARLRKETADEKAAAEAAAAGGADDGDEGGDAGAGDDDEGEGEGEGDGEGAAAEGDEGAQGDDDLIVVGLPARNAGEPDFELPIDVEFLEALGMDPGEVIERVNQLKNGYAYRREAEEIKQAAETQAAELDGIYDAMEEDPAGFLLEHVDPKLRSAVVDELILELGDQELQALAQRITGYMRDPDKRTLAKTTAERDRVKRERDRLSSTSESTTQKQYIRDLQTAISSVVPEGVAKERADLFVRTAARELQLHAAKNKLTTLDPAKVPEILSEIGLLETFNFQAPPRKNGGAGNGSGRNAAPPPKKPGAKPPVGGEPPAKGARLDRAKVADVRDRLKRRKSAASTTPSGAGSAVPSGFQKVQGESYLDRRNRVARALGLKEKKEL